MDTISLRSIWYDPIESLPEFVNHDFLIYGLHRLYSDDYYIGQTKDSLLSRFRLNTSWNHKLEYDRNNRAHRYNAIRFYGIDLFEVMIIDNDVIDCDDLNFKEEYYILEYDSYRPITGKGYNYSPGGSHQVDGMHLPQVYESIKKSHGGVLAWCTEEAQKKASDTKLKLYGSRYGRIRDPEVVKRAIEASRSPEVREKMRRTRLRRLMEKYHNSLKILFESEPDLYVKYYDDYYDIIKKYTQLILPPIHRLNDYFCLINDITDASDVLMHFSNSLHWKKDEIITTEREETPYDQYKKLVGGDDAKSVTPLMTSIKNRVSKLIELGFELTPYNYLRKYPTQLVHSQKHIYRVLAKLTELQLHPDWTPELDKIFKILKSSKKNFNDITPDMTDPEKLNLND